MQPDPIPPRTLDPAATRRRVIAAGLALFGRSGIEGVSTRDLAALAGVNTHALQYHFAGKAGVYRAVAEHVRDTSGAAVVACAEAALAGAETVAPAEAAARAGALLAGIVRVLLAQPDAPARAGFVLREQLDPTDAFALLFDGFIAPVHRALTTLVARASGHAADAPGTVIRAHALLGQALAFAIARETFRRRMDEAASGDAAPDEIASTVAALAEAALRPPSGDRPPPSGDRSPPSGDRP